MSNFEHIDDYLTNRLNPQEKANFESQLETDGALRADVEFQKLTIEAIKQARVAELKSMLNNVPVGGGFSTGLTAAKIAAGVISVALIGGLTYYYLQENTQEIKPTEVTTEETIKPVNPSISSTDSVNSIAVVEPSKTTEPVSPTLKKSETKKTQEQAVAKPKIEVLDLSDELTSNDNKKESALIENNKPEISASHIEVNTDSSNKKYPFHYQFSAGKLLLYGSFDKGLYEILEINGTGHSVFLFYQANYYLLEEKENVTSPLEAVKDPVLLKKLKEYRTR